MSEPTDKQQTSPTKYRFWLSFTALILSAVFGALAYLTFASGTALSGEIEDVGPQETLLRFDIIGAIFIIMVPVSFYTAYRLRPGGN